MATFPGALTIPGTRVSLAIGGFVKVLAFHDSNADERAADFSPADLVPDAPGGPTYGMTAGFVLIVRRRARVDEAGRRARGTLRSTSTVRPEAATTRVSAPPHGTYGSARGPDMVDVHERERTTRIFSVRRPRAESPSCDTHRSGSRGISRPRCIRRCSLEDPSSGDVGGDIAEARTPAPDAILSFVYQRSPITRLQLAGLVRRLQVRLADGSTPAQRWAQLSVVAESAERHVVRIEGLLGDGIGRYLQGLDGAGAGVVSPDGEIDTRRAWGGSACRTTPLERDAQLEFRLRHRECSA